MANIPWLADALRAEGIPVIEHGDWRNRYHSGSFNPFGVLWHHTAASTSSPSNPHPGLNVVINGRSDLPGPLAQALVDYNGVFHVISAGKCYHAGRSGGSGPIPAGDGNAMMVGWEIDYNGVSQHMSAAQYNNSVKATAAVLRQFGRDASYARGHRETSVTGKIDSSFIDLNRMRADVAAALAGGPTPSEWKTQFAAIDGDGRDEVIAVNPNGDVVAYRNVGGLAGSNQTFTAGSTLIARGFTNPGSVRFADIDGDGKAEIITINSNGDVVAYRNVGGLAGSNQTFTAGPTLIARGFTAAHSVRFADIDGDGKAEIITTGDTNYAWRNVGALAGNNQTYTAGSTIIAYGFQ